MTATRRAVSLASLVALGACDMSGTRTLDDVSLVTAFVVECDSAQKLGYCLGPSHQAYTMDYTVIVSRQSVFRYALRPFKQCIVLAPREWACTDDQGRVVEMKGFVMRWAELDSAHQAAVSKIAYCSAPDSARGDNPSFFSRLICSM